MLASQHPWEGGYPRTPLHKALLDNGFRLLVARWARKLSWDETAQSFHVSWADVYSSVQWVVEYGLQHRVLENIRAIGINEICVDVGRVFWTLIYQKAAHLGRQVPGRLVPESAAVQARTPQDRCGQPRWTPAGSAQLLSSQEGDFRRCHRGPEQQGQSNLQKILWLSHRQSPRNRSLSCTWTVARAGSYPWILLENQIFDETGKLNSFRRSLVR